MTITGKAYWARIQPDQLHDNYNEDGQEWTIDVSVDEATKAKLEKVGLGPKIKNKGTEAGDFIHFSRNENKKKTGEPNKPIQLSGVVDESVRIGNGSVVDVTFFVNTSPGFKGKPPTKRADILEVVVKDLVVYVPPKKEDFVNNEKKVETWS